MSQILKGVIFDYSTVLLDHRYPSLLGELRSLFESLREHEIKIVIVSTHQKNINEELNRRQLPPIDLFLTRSDVGGINKGSREWIDCAGERLEIENNRFLYIGDDFLDWRTAINAGTIYFQAIWSKDLQPGVAAFVVESPKETWKYITHFLLTPPRWSYQLDSQEQHLHIRSLLPASIKLPATMPKEFMLQKVLTEKKKVVVDKYNARDALMFHAISSLYLEGLMTPNAWFAVYPSSKRGKISDILQEYLQTAVKVFRGFYKEDLLIRAEDTIDTSLERVAAKTEGRRAKVSFEHQTDTVHVNPTYKRPILSSPKTIIVFDDFTTSGRSLEWARNLLYAAGAQKVILLTIGKYRGPYNFYQLKQGASISPYLHVHYKPREIFSKDEINLTYDKEAGEIVQRSFLYLRGKQAYPIE